MKVGCSEVRFEKEFIAVGDGFSEVRYNKSEVKSALRGLNFKCYICGRGCNQTFTIAELKSHFPKGFETKLRKWANAK